LDLKNENQKLKEAIVKYTEVLGNPATTNQKDIDFYRSQIIADKNQIIANKNQIIANKNQITAKENQITENQINYRIKEEKEKNIIG
jgi:hypothetical protein